MAYGIEELAAMQVTGPVKGGDMVMKPDQAPVGAAALLNKMQKKNTPGIFKLPSPDKEMPAFMKVAAEGVEEQNTANLENQEIMRIMGQYGVGPEEAKRIYDEMIYGYERDEAAVDPSDWRTILRILEAGGDPGTETETANLWQTWQKIKDRLGQDAADQWLASQEEQTAAMKFPGNFTNKDQNVTELPRNLKTAPDAEETKLAYITDDEQALLAFMKPGTPHRGPEGVPSYDSYDYGVYTTGEQMSNYESGYKQGTKADKKAAKASMKEREKARDEAAKDTSSQYHDQAVREQNIEKEMGSSDFKDWLNKSSQVDVSETVVDSGTKDESSILDFFGLGKFDMIAEGVADWEEAQVRKLIESIGSGDKAVGLGNLLRALGDQDRKESFFAKWGDKDWMQEELGDVEKEQGFDVEVSDEELFKRMLERAEKGGGDEFEKTYNPQKYYGSKPGENTADYQKRMRKLGVTAKELAQLQAEGKLKFTRANTQLIEEGRKRLEEERGGGKDRHSGTGQPTEQVTEETEVTENITPDARAGAWNVGGTMPYSDTLYTQGTEIDVPLGRRFEIDKDRRYLASDRTKDDIYKYATEGGYSQLEPFQNYLTRRQKHLGEQPDEWFDEEGNVIYSNTATV